MKIALLFIFLCYSVFSLAQKVTGIIVDRDGKPLQYASVFIKGSTIGANANNEGRYSLALAPGRYTLVVQYVGYQAQERSIVINNKDVRADFTLPVQEMTLGEVVVKNGEDPAYDIIRNTIKKRKYYHDQLDKFQCEVYTKGQLRVRSYPKSILGRKVNLNLDGDTSKNKMLFLSETVSIFSVDQPHKAKVDVISSRVSGDNDGYGLSAPSFFSLYDNNVFIGNNLNPRGFISPISDNALNYYRYKFEGSFFEDGKEIDRIRIIPKRKYEPLFSGYINIVIDDWRIHSVQLLLTKQSQMQLLDSLRMEQLWRPLEKDIWYVSSQVIYPSIKLLGFDAYGSFINVYSHFDVNPVFTKKTFGSTLLKYADSANRKGIAYWDTIRPVPLMTDEASDYKFKDSLAIIRKDPKYIDSMDRVHNRVNIFGFLLFEQTWLAGTRKISFTYRPLSEQLSFNLAEGVVINTGGIWTKRLGKSAFDPKTISIAPNLRYGFTNHHFNSHLTSVYTFGKNYASSVMLSGGKRVFQFNNNSPIGLRGNTLSTLLSEENRLKTYEAYYLRGSYKKGTGHGFSWTLAFQYQDRMPLDNRTNYKLRDVKNREYTPNYPSEIVDHNITHHQVFFTLAGITWQPGTKYIELPEQRINVGSNSPVMNLEYIRSYDHLFGSDEDFSKWKFDLTDHVNLKLLGVFRYRLGIGGFIDNDKVQLPDYQHFNGNISTFATEYVNSFQLLPIYQFSNISHFYSLAHVEHNFNGFLTNKVPGLRKLNLYLVAGANAFYINNKTNYYEYFIGLDNIFKQLRIDFVRNKLGDTGFRIGFSHNIGKRGDDWP